MDKFIEVYNQVDLNVLCALIVLGVFLYTSKYLKKEMKQTKHLKILTYVIIIELIIEAICFILEEFREPKIIVITQIAETINLSLSSLLGFVWIIFIYYYIYNKSPFTSIKKTIMLAMPLALTLALTITNHATGFIFNISQMNEYSRGPLFNTLIIATSFYVVYSFIFLNAGRKKISRKEFLVLMLYNVLPIAGVILQVLFQGITLSYVVSGFALTLLYVFLENGIVKVDHLTKVYARTYLDAYLDNLEGKKNIKMAICFIDLDDFKQINDKYGHTEGDFALVKFANIITETMQEEDIIARFGGDEFVIVFNTNNREKIEKALTKLRSNTNKFNKNQGKKRGYEIKYSAGYDILDEKYSSVRELLRAVDEKMYEEKLKKKVNKKSRA